VLQICRDQRIQVLFPIIDEELPLFADAAFTLARAGVHVVTNPPEVVRRASDKWRTYQWCREHGVRCPQTWMPSDSGFTFPAVVKPRSGRGSVGVSVVRDERALEHHLAQRQDRIIQEYVEGPEYTVDILADAGGKVISAVPRERLVTKAGMCTKGRTVSDRRLIDAAVRIAELFPLTPRGNVQLKCSPRDGEYYLIEVNPKFGAGLPLTTAAGVNMPLLLLRMLRGEPVPRMVGQFRENLVMLRHWAEVFVKEEQEGGAPCAFSSPEERVSSAPTSSSNWSEPGTG
jgi:carbamoyl-phosphate synthase large subunit